jgi:pimeloyl-ACP methyl ester carboxylesterase
MTTKLARVPQRCVLVIAMAGVFASVAAAQSRPLPPPEVPRERHANTDVIYSSVQAPDGSQVRVIITRPRGAGPKMPALFLAGWLSCNTVEVPKISSGFEYLLKRIVTESGMVMMRMDKQGVGDSEGGPCKELDFQRELAAYRAAFKLLRGLAYVNPDRIFILGMSNGGGFAPLVAEGAPVAGYIASGGWSRTWLEHMMFHERLRLTLSGRPPAEVNAAMRGYADFYSLYLNGKKTPVEVLAMRPELQPLWYDEPEHQYGRPARFYQQLQDLNLAEAWSKISSPTLAIHGELDWIMAGEDHRLIASLVNKNRPGAGKFVNIPGMDHFYMKHESMQASFRGDRGVFAEDAAEEILDWLKSQR